MRCHCVIASARRCVRKRSSWEGFHGGWPAIIVARTCREIAGWFRVGKARVHVGNYLRNRRFYVLNKTKVTVATFGPTRSTNE